jgi:hypothetical protein
MSRSPPYITSNQSFNFPYTIQYNKEINKMNRTMLEQAFDAKYIKQRKGNFGQMLDYLETHLVIQRLNDSFDGNWSFDIVSHEKLADEVIVLGRLTAGGISKMQFGSNKITRATKDGSEISIGDDLKSATSDCLKKCSTLLGVGLHLYGELIPSDIASEPANTTSKDSTTDKDTTSNDTGNNGKPKTDMESMSPNLGSNLITKEQLAQIKKLRTEYKLTPEDVQAKCNRLFGTTDIMSLNKVMATALIANISSNGGNGSK